MSETVAASVILWCHGDDRAALATLAALARQTLAGIEVVLAGDVPAEEVLAAAASSPRGMVVRRLDADPVAESPADSPAGRNRAVAVAGGPYVLELAAGSIPAPTMLEKCAWAIGTRLGVCMALAGPLHESGTADVLTSAIQLDRQGSNLSDVRPGAYVFRKAAWVQAKGLSADVPACAVDADLCLTMLDQGWTVTRLGEELPGPLMAGDWAACMDDACLRERHAAAYRRADADRRRHGRWVSTRAAVPIAGQVADRVAAKLEATLVAGLDGNGVDAVTIDRPQKRQALTARCDGPRRPGLRA